MMPSSCMLPHRCESCSSLQSPANKPFIGTSLCIFVSPPASRLDLKLPCHHWPSLCLRQMLRTSSVSVICTVLAAIVLWQSHQIVLSLTSRPLRLSRHGSVCLLRICWQWVGTLSSVRIPPGMEKACGSLGALCVEGCMCMKRHSLQSSVRCSSQPDSRKLPKPLPQAL